MQNIIYDNKDTLHSSMSNNPSHLHRIVVTVKWHRSFGGYKIDHITHKHTIYIQYIKTTRETLTFIHKNQQDIAIQADD